MRSNRHNFADLDDAFAAVVFALVGDQFGSSCGKCGIKVQHGLEVEVSDGVMVRGGAGREGADAAVDFNAHETTGQEELAREHKVRAKVVVPIEGRPGDSRVKHTEADHGLGISCNGRECQ